MKKVRYIFFAAIALVVIGAGYYGISPLFRNIKMDEALPQKAQQYTAGAEVMGTTGHPASGTVRIVGTDDKTYVRYENFKTINGPDIFVYLSKDLDAKEFINLGKVRATEGNINYEIPTGVNVSDYRYVLTWCRAFHVLFNYADLAQ